MSSINYEQEYQQAQIAYLQSDYEKALTLANQLTRNYPNNSNHRLLIANIYSIFQQYDLAKEQYRFVLSLSKDTALIDCASEGIECAEQCKTFCCSADIFLEPYAQLETNVQFDEQNSSIRFEADIVFKNQTSLKTNKQKEKLDLQHLSEPLSEVNALKGLSYSTHRYQKQEGLKINNTNTWDFNPFENPQQTEFEFDQLLSNCLETLKDSSTSERIELLKTDVINPFRLEQSKNF